MTNRKQPLSLLLFFFLLFVSPSLSLLQDISFTLYYQRLGRFFSFIFLPGGTVNVTVAGDGAGDMYILLCEESQHYWLGSRPSICLDLMKGKTPCTHVLAFKSAGVMSATFESYGRIYFDAAHCGSLSEPVHYTVHLSAMNPPADHLPGSDLPLIPLFWLLLGSWLCAGTAVAYYAIRGARGGQAVAIQASLVTIAAAKVLFTSTNILLLRFVNEAGSYETWLSLAKDAAEALSIALPIAVALAIAQGWPLLSLRIKRPLTPLGVFGGLIALSLAQPYVDSRFGFALFVSLGRVCLLAGSMVWIFKGLNVQLYRLSNWVPQTQRVRREREGEEGEAESGGEEGEVAVAAGQGGGGFDGAVELQPMAAGSRAQRDLGEPVPLLPLSQPARYTDDNDALVSVASRSGEEGSEESASYDSASYEEEEEEEGESEEESETSSHASDYEFIIVGQESYSSIKYKETLYGGLKRTLTTYVMGLLLLVSLVVMFLSSYAWIDTMLRELLELGVWIHIALLMRHRDRSIFVFRNADR